MTGQVIQCQTETVSAVASYCEQFQHGCINKTKLDNTELKYSCLKYLANIKTNKHKKYFLTVTTVLRVKK